MASEVPQVMLEDHNNPDKTPETDSSSKGDYHATSEATNQITEISVQCIQVRRLHTTSSQDDSDDEVERAITQQYSSVFVLEVHQCRLCTSFSSTQKKKFIKHIKEEHPKEFQILKDTKESPLPERAVAKSVSYQAHLEEILEKELATQIARKSDDASSITAASKQGVVKVYNVKPRVLRQPQGEVVISATTEQVPDKNLQQKWGRPKSIHRAEEDGGIGTQGEAGSSEGGEFLKQSDSQCRNRLRPVLSRKAKARVRQFKDFVVSNPHKNRWTFENSGDKDECDEDDENEDVNKDKSDTDCIPDNAVETENQGLQEHQSTVLVDQPREALHLKNGNLAKKQFKCLVCHFMYRTSDALKRHIKLNRCIGVPITNKEFPCNKCDYKASSAAGLKIHLHSHQQRGERKFGCASCRKGFTSLKGVKKHRRNRCPVLKKKIPKVPKTYPCEQCERIFKDRKGVKEHMSTHSLIRNYKCNFCTKAFKTVGALRRHCKKHQDTFFYCDQCNFKTKWRSSLKTHFIAHHAEDARECFQCPQCPHQTKNKYYLKRHIESHTDSRLFICEICGKDFKTQVILNAHRERHEDGRYPCSKCDYIGKTKMAIYSHQLVHLPREKMNYKCEHCSWIGKRKSELHMHYRKHSSEKFYQCSECEKSYKHRHGLTRHIAEKHLRTVELSNLEVEEMAATEEQNAAVLNSVQEMMHSAQMELDVVHQSQALNGVPAIIQAAEMHDRELGMQQYQLIPVHDAQITDDEEAQQDNQLMVQHASNVAITSVPVAQIFEISTSDSNGRDGHL